MDQVLLERLSEVTPRLDRPVAGGKAGEAEAGRFAEIVGGLIADVNARQNQAADDAQGLARGEVGLMDAVVSLDEADLSLRMMMQLRDRVLDAYNRIMQTL